MEERNLSLSVGLRPGDRLSLVLSGIQLTCPSRAVVFIHFVPVNGVLLATLFLGEPLTLSLLTGGALVVSGAYLANAVPTQKAVTAI